MSNESENKASDGEVRPIDALVSRTEVALNSPYGYMKPFGTDSYIPNGTKGKVEGKINPTRGNRVFFEGFEHIDNLKVPSHWLTVPK